ncbi:MAG: DNA double-strand break repair nuclease NurA [Candidatus Bathyarchaeota archaeon]|nr:DNA double-strand break repair nuclease NurA [Candidatus Bathyarchaeota archaeon]
MDERVIKEIKSTADCLCTYAEKGRAIGSLVTVTEPIMAHEPKLELLKPLKVFSSVDKVFAAVDCSTIPLMRGNNFGAYVFRVAATLVKPQSGKEVNWSYEEHFQSVVGNEVHRKARLQSIRFDYESKMGLPLLDKLDRDDYLILDGGSYFGGTRGFSVSLYEECRKRGIKLLTVSKKTQSTMTSKGTDFLATLLTKCMDKGVWLYHPFAKAKSDEHLYGDISFIKLNLLTPIAFRCDIMEYLADTDLVELVSPLTALSQDARCFGYPVCLYLAHHFTKTASPKLTYYREVLERELREKHPDALRKLLVEEMLANFRSQVLYGAKHLWDWEGSEIV